MGRLITDIILTIGFEVLAVGMRRSLHNEDFAKKFLVFCVGLDVVLIASLAITG